MQPQSNLVRTWHRFLLKVFPTTLILLIVGLASPAARGQVFNTLYRFSGPDGIGPGAVIEGRDGALYGTTTYGGANPGPYGYGNGTVFKINIDGTGFQTLHSFSFNGPDGAYPNTLIEGPDGALYGTANYGGNGSGTVFKVNTDGTGFQTVHAFDGSHGAQPSCLIQGQDGALYGTADFGSTYGFGTLFKVNSDGTHFKTLHAFNNSDGFAPAAVTEGQDGALYGAAARGGANGVGTVFKMNTDGTGFQLLYSFSALDANQENGDGCVPGILIEGRDGALCGTTTRGGANGNGTLFKVNTDGTGFQIVHTFSALDSNQENGDGIKPSAMIEGQDGSLYGTTSGGGANGNGTLFNVNTDGTGFQTVYAFSYDLEAVPSDVIEGQDGAFYVTTAVPMPSLTGGALFQLSLNPISVKSVNVTPNPVLCSLSTTGTVTLTAPAFVNTTVQLASDNSAASVPATVTVSAGQSSQTFPVTLSGVSATTTVTLSATLNGSTVTTSLTVLPISVQSLSVSPNPVFGPYTAVATLTLNIPVPADTTVQLFSSNSVASIPATVTVPAGQSSQTFPVTLSEVSAITGVGLIATLNGGAVITSVTVLPIRVQSLSAKPNPVTGGRNAAGTLTFTGPLPVSISVALQSNSPAAMVPATVTIPAGSTSATFTIQTAIVGSDTRVSITAAFGGITRRGTLLVKAPTISALTLTPTHVTGGHSARGIVTLTGPAPPAGVTVSLVSDNPAITAVPASITIASGLSRATFSITTTAVTTTTAVHISASVGSITKTAALTVTP